MTKSISHAKISKSSGERTHKNEYGRVPEWPMGTDCKSAAFSFGGSNPPAPTKKTSVENTLVFCFIRYFKFHSRGWIRTASTRRIVRRGKKPLRGFFRCAARDIHPRPPNSQKIRMTLKNRPHADQNPCLRTKARTRQQLQTGCGLSLCKRFGKRKRR